MPHSSPHASAPVMNTPAHVVAARQKLAPILVLDLDGTLVNSAPDLIGALNHVLVSIGLPEFPVAKAHDLVGAGVRVLLERGLAHAGKTVSGAEFTKLEDQFIAYYAAHIADLTRPFPNCLESLARFKAAGWKLAVCTNKLEHLALKLIADLNMTAYFDAITGRNSFEWCKPHARHLIDTIERAGGDIHRAIMVGDSITDIDTARNAGVPSIGVPFGYTDTPMKDLNPTVLMQDFSEMWDIAHRLVKA